MVVPQLVHRWQVPLRISARLPQFVQGSASDEVPVGVATYLAVGAAFCTSGVEDFNNLPFGAGSGVGTLFSALSVSNLV